MRGGSSLAEYKVYSTTLQDQTNGSFDATDVQQNRVMGILSYIGILVLIPYFAAKKSAYARYHTQQGITVVAGEVAYSIVYFLLRLLVNAIFPPTNMFWYTMPNPVATLISFILSLFYIFFTVLAICGIVNAAKGLKKPVPILGKFSSLFDFMFRSDVIE